MAAIAAASLFSRDARADISDALYYDAKGIIEELLTKEVSQQVGPNLVCLAGRRSNPAAGDPGSLPLTWIDESSVEHRETFSFEALRYLPRTIQDIYDRQFSSLRATILDETADYAGFVTYQSLVSAAEGTDASARVAAQNSKILSAKLGGYGAVAVESEKHESRAGDGSLQFAPLDQPAFDACSSAVRLALKERKFSAGASVLDTKCGAAAPRRNEYACDLALALRDTILNKPASAEEFIVRAVSGIFAEAVAGVGATKVFDRVLLAMRPLLSDFARDDTTAAKAAVEELKAIASTTPDAPQAPAIDGAVMNLRIKWRALKFSTSARMDLATFVDELASSDLLAKDVCASAPSGVGCRALVAAKTDIDRSNELLSIARLASRGRARDVARKSIQVIFKITSEELCGEKQARCASIQLYSRFASAVVAYAIDQEEGTRPSDASREAFRSAATEILEEIAEGGGFDRRFRHAVFLPDLGLRFLWSPGYVNAGESTTRAIASANWINFRWRLVNRPFAYSAIQLSLFDPLAPLSELAVRRTDGVSYSGTDTKLLANLVAPRVDFVFGVPALSKHIVVGAGISARLAAPIMTDEAPVPGAIVKYRYEYIGATPEVARFIEFGFLVKYFL